VTNQERHETNIIHNSYDHNEFVNGTQSCFVSFALMINL